MIETITANKAAIALVLSILIIGYCIWKDSRKKYRIRYDWHTELYSVVYEDEFGDKKVHSAFFTKDIAQNYCKALNNQKS